MRTLGINFEEEQLRELRALARADRRAVGFLVRDAVDFYLGHRKLAKEREQAQQAQRSEAQ